MDNRVKVVVIKDIQPEWSLYTGDLGGKKDHYTIDQLPENSIVDVVKIYKDYDYKYFHEISHELEKWQEYALTELELNKLLINYLKQ